MRWLSYPPTCREASGQATGFHGESWAGHCPPLSLGTCEGLDTHRSVFCLGRLQLLPQPGPHLSHGHAQGRPQEDEAFIAKSKLGHECDAVTLPEFKERFFFKWARETSDPRTF